MGNPPKSPEGFSNQILSGVMAFVVGVITMLRLTSSMPRKITDAALDYATTVCADGVPKGPMRQCQLPPATVSPVEHAATLKRLSELEEKVTTLSKKPAEMAPEKEEILQAAVRRVDSLEAELMATKKALQDALVRQEELLAYIDKKKKKKKSILNPFRW